MRRKSMVMVMIALIMLLSACGKDHEPAINEPSEIDVENEMTEVQKSAVDPSIGKALEVIVRNDKTADFIFDSDTAQGTDNLTAVTVQFTKDYLIGLNDFDAVGKYQCSMWRVEGNDRSLMEDIGAIAARHGRKFKDEGLQAYFDSKSWYFGYCEPDNFNTEYILNEIEKKNMDFIKEHEK